MEKQTLHIPNISCTHCVRAIIEELSSLEGVRNVEGNQEDRTISVLWEKPLTIEKIREELRKINYPAE